ncbi:hypothetical protein PVAP13_5KG222707 [Panicum virgatum]|uniref:Uncharacterized protein n=1 Tax=Panicum virgatum TaxID=38727 RepID=A0A8T0SF37_PANVG|nr:hypothetical protein PVAP13_5KG222707 [Panicum virgatum]
MHGADWARDGVAERGTRRSNSQTVYTYGANLSGPSLAGLPAWRGFSSGYSTRHSQITTCQIGRTDRPNR